jgi:uroporphyrinogen decarboxylase
MADLESFPYPTVEGCTADHMAAAVEAAHAAGVPALGGIGHMYETAWQIRGYEEFLEDMMLRPEWCEYILDRLMARNLAVARAAAAAKADVLHTGDDVANQNAMMFSPAQWRRFMKSRWAKVYAAAREIHPGIEIWYHSDGNIEAILPELIEIGVTILNPVQPECMDPVSLKKRWGDRLVFDGTIGTQSTMPFGSADDVRRVVAERRRTLGRDGALILAPTHVLEPEVPVENILAFVEAAKAPEQAR